MSIMFAWRKKSNVGGGRIHYITNESGAKLSKSMRCIYYRDDGEDGGVGLLQEQEIDSGSWYK